MKSPALKALLEAGRLIFLGGLASLISFVVNSGKLSPELISFLLIIGRVVDKFLHELGKEFDNQYLAKGITRF